MQRKPLLVALGVIVLVMVFMAATGLIVWRIAKRTVQQEILAPQEKTVDISILVTQVRELHRLETAAMHVVHVGRVSQTYRMVPNALGGDEITFLAAGEVIAGIDLSRLQSTDVWRSADGTLNLRLPPPQVLVTRVDNEKSRVIARKTGMLRRADVDLETRARQHAEQNIRSEAIKKGVLPLARENAEKKLSEFLHTLGFERVRFVSAPAPLSPR
jgi:Protein of unknown function (DUF4230)